MTMHVGEFMTDPDLVRRLLRGRHPEWADLHIEPVPSFGTDHALYRLGDDMVVRMPRVDRAVDNIEKEQRWLPWLAPSLPVAVPAPLGGGDPAEGYPFPWSVYRWLDGQDCFVVSPTDPSAFARDLAEFVLALRRLDPVDGPPAGRGVPLAERDAPTRDAIARSVGLIDIDAVTAAWDAALAVTPWTGPPVWIHGDLSPGNVLCVDGRLAAVIDFGCLGVGDPACDMIVAWNLLSHETRDVFRVTLGVDTATWARGRGWALSIALIQLPYYLTTNPTLAANARHVIGEVLTDHGRG
jgi:aminoglycoside phosphotransferase (APT) family kinase protein